ncbi:IS5 family transposase [Nitratireductor sp. GCM10026969]|uniref:IS5 family transposase n=1 Tax=Nitratireductor sp. GCM10026969 TaxID=3252645 RepID=UPI0036197DA0
MSDAEWLFFVPFLDEHRSRGGRGPQDHRKVLDGIFWITRTGSPWRDLPAEFGNWNSVHRQLSPLDRGRDPGRDAVCPCRKRGSQHHHSDDRQHDREGAPARSRRKRGIHRNAIGRSRGGLTTKLHTRTDAQGLAIGLCLTPGQASDMVAYESPMQEEAPEPAAMLADKGYDSDAIRDDLKRRGTDPVIPTKSNRRVQRTVDMAKYALHNRIERFFNRLKHSRRITTR